MLLNPFGKPGRLTRKQFRDAFHIPGLTTPSGTPEATLVHPILPSVSRVGLWYAIPRDSKVPEKVELRLEPNGPHPAPTIIHQPLDRVGRIIAEGLPPGKCFEATLLFDGKEERTVSVRTAPTDNSKFSFLAYSCFAPFPKKGNKAFEARTVHSLNLLERRSSGPFAKGEPRPAFALATGDQVYVDADVILRRSPPKRALLFGLQSQLRRYPDGADAEEIAGYFEELYAAYLRLAPYEQSLRTLPHAMMWDDHDIRDGWGSQGDEAAKSWKAHLNAARKAFISHQYLRNSNPVAYPNFDSLSGPAWVQLLDSMVAEAAGATRRPELHFQFEWGPAARFFVMDLRSRREAKSKTVVSDHQLAAIAKWLSAGGGQGKRPTLYVLVSSLPLTYEPEDSARLAWQMPFRADDRRDSWWSDESRRQRDQLLALLLAHFRANEADRLLVLSGDVHFAEILSLSLDTPTGSRVFGHEIISSGLAQASYHAGGHRADFGDPQQPIVGFYSQSAGSRLFAPHFAEIFVHPGEPNQVPSVDVLFYPASETETAPLVNPVSELHQLVTASSSSDQGPLSLPVGNGAEPTELKNFGRFMLPWSNSRRGDEDVNTWSL